VDSFEPRRAVFLDRDGVLIAAPVRNGLPYSPREPDEVDVLPGVAEACAALREVGFVLVVVTNQPDVARGSQTLAGVEQINERLREQVLVDEIVVCPHDDADECACRKPRPGMLIEAARRRKLDLARSFMVGDRWRDIAAGRSAGCTVVFVERGYAEPLPEPDADANVPDLPVAVEWILSRAAKVC
jgi:D-glycero-D-manno-heptose 1,7-bisphosphate phosphatase